MTDIADLTTGYGLVIVGECQYVPAAAFEHAVKTLRDHVASEIGAIAKPRQIMIVAELPKTRSGKSCAACCAT